MFTLCDACGIDAAMKQTVPKRALKEKVVAFRVDEDTLEDLKLAARKDQRTLSQWISLTLRRVLEDGAA
jgi:hypothetical protein